MGGGLLQTRALGQVAQVGTGVGERSARPPTTRRAGRNGLLGLLGLETVGQLVALPENVWT